MPTILKVPLAHISLVEETIIINIVMSEVILIMCQQLCAQ